MAKVGAASAEAVATVSEDGLDRVRRFALLFLGAFGSLTPLMLVLDAIPAVCCPDPGPREEILAFAEQLRVWGIVAWLALAALAAIAAGRLVDVVPSTLGDRRILREGIGLVAGRILMAAMLIIASRYIPLGSQDGWAFTFFEPNLWDFYPVLHSAWTFVAVYVGAIGLLWRGHLPKPWVVFLLPLTFVGARNVGLVWALWAQRPGL